MPDDETVTASRESAIGDERDFLSEAGPHDRTRGPEHLPHSGTTLGAFHANHDDITGFDPATEDGLHRLLFGIVDLCLSGEGETFLS